MGKRITEYEEVDSLTERDYLLIDGQRGTKLIDSHSLLESMKGLGLKRTIYRGSNLGIFLNSKQYNSIQAGTFEGLCIGDYWARNGIVWRIADLDPFYSGKPGSRHHIVVVPDSVVGYSIFSSDSAVDYYTISNINFGSVRSSINNIFGISSGEDNEELIFEDGRHSDYLNDKSIFLMSETEVFGNLVNGLYNYSNSTNQFAMFKLNPKLIKSNNHYWLRDGLRSSLTDPTIKRASSSTKKALYTYGSVVSRDGYILTKKISERYGIRPFVVIK